MMKYFIKKILFGKWSYWIDFNGEWNGLKMNAAPLSEITASKLFEQYDKAAKLNEEILMVSQNKFNREDKLIEG